VSGACCEGGLRFEGQSAAYRRVLWLVIAINAAMFLTETVAGWLAGSVALQADALDFLGDSLTYAISLLVIGRPDRWRASAALFKGISLAAMGLWVLGFTAYRVLVLDAPEALVMGAVGVLALAANVGSALLLYRFRNGDANVRSVWLCSRNDAIGNVAVVGAAGLVALSGSGWPDVAVAAAMACLFLSSAIQIVRQALGELAQADSRLVRSGRNVL
jgi:Co/Zn/Cd efflux system component